MNKRGASRTALLSALAFSSVLYGQVNGRVSGSVIDTSGAAIPGAAVTLTLSGGAKATFKGQTTGDGLFSFTGVRPETYDISVEATGFSRQLVRGIVVDPGREAAIPAIHLEVGSMAETVEISSTVSRPRTRRIPSACLMLKCANCPSSIAARFR
jgi:hypothetical protein